MRKINLTVNWKKAAHAHGLAFGGDFGLWYRNMPIMNLEKFAHGFGWVLESKISYIEFAVKIGKEPPMYRLWLSGLLLGFGIEK